MSANQEMAWKANTGAALQPIYQLLQNVGVYRFSPTTNAKLVQFGRRSATMQFIEGFVARVEKT
jgi:hypothetical protein